MSWQDYFPEDPPNWDDFWRARPFGPDFTLNPFTRDWPYAAAWGAISYGGMSGWTAYTGRGINLNTFFGRMFFPTPQVSVTGMSGRAHWHTRGASPSFVEGVSRAMYSRLLVPSVSIAARAAPVVAVASAAAVATVATHDVIEGAVTGGSAKPAWIPLPIWAWLWS